MKPLPALLVALLLMSFKNPKSCERLQPNSITIFPVCGDSSLYIQRKFKPGKFIFEDVYQNRLRTFSTKIWLSGKAMPDSVLYTEFTYWHGRLINTRSLQDLESALRKKAFRINDTLHFEINYHDNGSIMSYGFMNSFCWLYGVDSDPGNKFFWKGPFQPPVSDTIKYPNATAYEPSITINTKCGDPTGMWRKLDVSGHIVDSVDMTGSVSESASWRKQQLIESKGGLR